MSIAGNILWPTAWSYCIETDLWDSLQLMPAAWNSPAWCIWYTFEFEIAVIRGQLELSDTADAQNPTNSPTAVILLNIKMKHSGTVSLNIRLLDLLRNYIQSPRLTQHLCLCFILFIYNIVYMYIYVCMYMKIRLLDLIRNYIQKSPTYRT